MKKSVSLKILLLLTVFLGLASCGDDNVYYTIQNSDEKLCGSTWVEEFQTTNDDNVEVICNHQLKFAKSKSGNDGQEVWEYYRSGETRPYETVSKRFSWSWLDSNMEGLELNYGGGEITYFDNVWVRENYLSGMLDGVNVTFRRK